MTELKLGNKYECFNCGVKFYDLGRGSSICPKCGADQKDAEAKDNPLVAQSVKRRRRAELQPDDEPAAAAPAEEIEIDDEDELPAEDLELDTSELEDDEEEEEEEED